MPPKQAKAQPSKKQVQEKTKKVVEDRTFGLKNKKGAKAQKFIQQIQKQTQNNQKAKENESRKRKEQKEKELKELNEIFKPVISKQKIEAGVNPKSVLCAYFKVGQCMKGDKCKFSHDLNVEKKSAKKDIYTDVRDLKDKEETEVEDDTDQVLDEDSIRKFHICNHFLEAVEADKFGWFWECPNGEKCKYKHALPRGYKLKKDVKVEVNTDDQTLEELLALDKSKFKEYDPSKMEGTPVTLERFLEWKAKFVKEMEKDKPVEKKTTDRKLTGRELFTVNPNMEADGEDDGGISIYDTIEMKNRKEAAEQAETIDEGEEDGVEIDEDLFAGADDIDDLEEELNELSVNENERERERE